MAGERTLKVTILGDAKRLGSTFDEVDGHVSRLGGSFTKLAGIATGAFAALGAGALFKSAVDGASDLNETLSKVNVVFGTAADAATVYGQSLSEAQTEATKAQEKYQDAVEKSEDRIRDVREAAAEKARDAAEKIKDAETRVADVTKDATDRVKDAKESAAEVAENVAERIKDAEASAAERVENAQERQKDAHERAAEKREEAAARVIDAERELAKAQQEGAKPEVIERLSERVNDARENQAKVTDRTAKDIAKADKDAAKAAQDAAKDVERAKKDGAKAVEDANERVTKAEDAGKKAVEAAEKAVAKARADAAKIHEETAKAEAKIRDGLVASRNEANEAQAKVAEIERLIAKSRADVARDGGIANAKWGKQIEEFADTAAKKYGLSKQSALDASATFAIFGKAAGMQDQNLVDFSKKMTGLAADLASFHNTKPEQAIEAIGAAMRGESEPIRAFGVMLNDATLKARAMKLGIYDGTGALTAQQKVLATQAEILAQTTDAQGDFARTSDGAAGKQKILAAEMANASTAIGQKLLPAFSGLVTMAGDLLTAWNEDGFRGVFNRVADIWGELWPKIKEKLGEFLQGLGDWIVAEGPGILRKLGEWTGQFLEWVGSMIPPLLSKLGELLGKMLQWVSDHREEIFDKLGEWTKQFTGWAADMLLKLLDYLVDVVIPAVFKWIKDNGPTILLELGKWTASFIAWVAKMNLELLAALAGWIKDDVLPWIGDQAGKILDKLGEWTKQFTAWVVGLPGAMAGEMAKLISWFGDQALNLPGQLVRWTTAFATWLGDLAGNITGALTDFAGNLAEAIWNFIKDRLSGIFSGNGGVGGSGFGVSTSGTKVKFENGRWVYSGGPKDGQAVPASELSSEQRAMQGGGGGGSAPTNSQGTPGQTFAQMAASGMTVAEIAEKTGLDPAVIQANLTVANAGAFVGSVLGGDHDDENDGDLSPSGPGEQNLTANAVKLRRQIQASFKGYSSIGGYAYRTTAAGTPSDHATGKALDVMMPRLHDPLGDKIAAWAVGENETKYVIWDNQIWSRQKPYWRDYATSGKVGAANQGSATGRHEDHVHISVLGKGGIVRARQGGTLALLGEAGQDEAVVPLPRGGGTAVGTTVVVHVHGNVIRERDLALSIRDGLLDLQRQGVSLGFN